MNDSALTLTSAQRDFVRFLTHLWRPDEELEPFSPDEIADITSGATRPARNQPSRFFHWYPITNHGSWRQWKDGEAGARGYLGPDYARLREKFWWCTSLKSARDHYSWKSGSAAKFATLSTQLQAALSEREIKSIRIASRVRQLCLEIFEWGGVARRHSDPSRIWVDVASSSAKICAFIEGAVFILNNTSRRRSSRTFNGPNFLMNSSMTKVYAAADRDGRVVMYDGRVGAALGLLTRIHLQLAGINAVPPGMEFPWGPAHKTLATKNRNPSIGSLRFPSIYTKNGQYHAEYVMIAGDMIASMLNHLHAAEDNATARDVEMALFMIGCNV